MNVTDISVFYRRQVQPAQYEAEEVRLEGRAVLEEGENWERIGYDMLTRARVQAHRAIGLDTPTVAPFAGEEVQVQPAEKPASKSRSTKGSGSKSGGSKSTKKAEPAPEEVTDDAVEGSAPVDDSTSVEAPAADEDFNFDLDEAKEIDDKELHSAASTAARKYGSPAVKELMQEFGVARLGELAQNKRQAFLNSLVDL